MLKDVAIMDLLYFVNVRTLLIEILYSFCIIKFKWFDKILVETYKLKITYIVSF